MMIWPDWTKLYDKGQCLAYGVPFGDEQQAQIDWAETQTEKEELVREFREEYQKKLKEEHTKLENEPEKVGKPEKESKKKLKEEEEK